MNKVVIIGGGASGLIASIFASKDNEVLLLERNNNCGKKILITGNGKCNYWNSDFNIKHYNNSSIEELITKENEKKVLDFFDSIGVVPKIKNGYYYPYSNQATSICEALILQAQLLGVKIYTNCFVKSIKKDNNKFLIETNLSNFESDNIILSTGSCAAPKTGSDGNGYELLKIFNHTIVKPLPALVSLNCKETFKECSGVREDVNIKLYENNSLIKEENGEILLTDYGVSGICVMQLSGLVSKGLDMNKKEQLNINFLPFLKNEDDFIKWMNQRNKKVLNRSVIELLDGVLNYKLVNLLAKKSKIFKEQKWDEIANKKLLAHNIISFNIEVTSTNSFDKAQVITGGLSLDEINIKTMESKLVKGLYVTGELLDINGDCGGYNLAFAWISGMIAGNNVKGD